ncbi:MAG: hypothetical protein JJU22_10465 [Gammaproteobacteria bacterium]|nr:hypothetical protein [Gammaproteobacteria bacterium]
MTNHDCLSLPLWRRGHFLGLLLVLLATLPLVATAQWWRFGTDAGEPVFTDLLFNQIPALDAERKLELSRDDLESGRVIVRGRAEIGEGRIGRVEASLDAGVTWIEIPFNERGLFAFEFAPELDRLYPFRIRALSTTGVSSNELDHALDLTVARFSARDMVALAFEQLIQRYAARDQSGFMGGVADDFVGNAQALDSALSNDFRIFDAIRIQPTIRRITGQGGRYQVNFQFERQVRSVRSGELFRDRATSSMIFVRGPEGYLLHEMAAPLIFGLSDAAELATFAEAESTGAEVIHVDADGGIDKRPLGAPRQPSAPAPNGLAITNLRVVAADDILLTFRFDFPRDIDEEAERLGLNDEEYDELFFRIEVLLEMASEESGPWTQIDRDQVWDKRIGNVDRAPGTRFYRARAFDRLTGEFGPYSNVVRFP